MGRAILRTVAALIVLAATGVLLWRAEGGPVVPSITALQALDPAALGTALRLSVWTVLAVLLLLLVLRAVVAGALLLDLGYAPLAYLGKALALPAVQKAAEGVAAGVMLAQLAGQSGVAAAAQVARGTNTHVVAAGVAASASARGGMVAPTGGTARNAAVGDAGATSDPALRTDYGHPPVRTDRDSRARQMRKARVLLGRGAWKAQGAVLYTVQAGDTLSGIARRLYGDALAYPRLFRANAGRVLGDGQRLTVPWLIQPGWRLVVPLPSPIVTLEGAHLRYVVQQGDSLSSIAAGLLGEWRRYTELVSINAGRHEPEGVPLTNPNVIKPGWSLLLPQSGVYVRPRTARAPRPASGPRYAAIHHRKVLLPRAHAVLVKRQRRAHPAHSRHVPTYRLPVWHEVPRPVTLPVAHPRPQVKPALAPGSQPRRTERLHESSPRPARLLPRTRPTVLLPDGRTISAALAALFLGAVALAARRRRRGRSGAGASGILSTAPIRSLADTTLRPGMRGWLNTALSGRMRGDEADKVAPMLERLEAALAERGLGHPRVRWVREGDTTLTVALATGTGGARILEAARDDLQRHLGCVVAGVRADRGGALLELGRVPVPLRDEHAAARTGAGTGPSDQAGTPHPVPLLAPLGADTGDGQVVHANLAHLGSLLIASGPTAGAQPLLVTLLAHVAAQVSPDQVRLLVISEPGPSASALAQLPHLVLPPADPADLVAVGTALDHVDTILVERNAGPTDDEDMVGPPPMVRQKPTEPAVVLAIDSAERLLADPLLVSRVDTICRQGAASGVCVVATTDDVSALMAENALVGAFAGRAAFRLADADQSRHVLGEEGAEQLAPGELLWTAGGGGVEQLHTLALSEADAREVLTAIATAHQPSPPLHLMDPPADDTEGDAAPADGADDAGESGSDRADQVFSEPASAVLQGPAVAGETAAPEPGSAQPDDATPELVPVVTAPADAAPSDAGVVGGTVGAVSSAVEATPAIEAGNTLSSAGNRREAGETRRAPMSVRLFGGIQIEIVDFSGTPRGLALPRQQQELLAFLALQPGQTASRDRIAEAFWPDEDPAVSLNRFHRMVRKLREGLAGPLGVAVDGAAVQQRSSDYHLHPGLVWVDAVAFEETLTQAAVAVDEERAKLLQRAVDLHTGDLFGDRMPEWAQNQMWHLRERYLDAVRDLAKWYEAQGHQAQALAMALRLCQAEPTREAYHRRVMRLQAQIGDLEAVKRQYAHLCTTLQAEVGAQPEERTQQLYRHLVASPDKTRSVVMPDRQMAVHQVN